MVVSDALEDGLGLGGQENDAAVLLHFDNVAFPHGDASAAGDDDVLSGLHLDEEFGLAVAEVFFTVYFEDIRDGHAFSSGDDLVHFDHIHGEHCVEVV